MLVDFECPRCGTVVEREFGNGKFPTCSVCKVEMLRKYGVGAIIFKGSGFAKNS